MFTAIGISPRAQRCYELLIAHPDLTAADLTERLEESSERSMPCW